METEETRDSWDEMRELPRVPGFAPCSKHTHSQSPFHPGPCARDCTFVNGPG